MFRDNLELRRYDNINFVLSHGSLGDAITSLPAVCWARKMHSLDMRMTVWVAAHQVALFEHLIGGTGLVFKSLAELPAAEKTGDKNLAGPVVVNYTLKDQITRNRYDMVSYAFATLLDRQVECIEELNYPHWAPLGERPLEAPYIVFPISSTNDMGVFHPSVLEPIIEWALARGLQPVFTGSFTTNVVMLEKGKPIPLRMRDTYADIRPDLRDKAIDMRGKTATLLELRDWLGHAAAVVGVDGGALHLAGTTEVPIVYGCTRVSPRHRPICRFNELNWKTIHVEPTDLECAGCQSNWTLMFHHNFGTCAYGDAKCVTALNAEDFIDALQELEIA